MGNYLTSDFVPDLSAIPMYIKTIGALVIGSSTLIAVYRRLKDKQTSVKYPKNTVILHQLGRGPWAPSMTPFAIKLETYLRMADIPYMNVHSMKTSSKGKFPWMEYNGDCVADSQFCIEYLSNKLNIDLNKHLTDEEKGVGKALQKMAEENTYWTYVLFRWCFDQDMKALSGFGVKWYRRWYVQPLFRKKVFSLANAHGMGRHSKEEVYVIMMADLRAFSDFLGQKKYFFGDKPCEMDCAIFGQLAQIKWQTFGNPPETAIREFPNLCDYCERMKAKFWPDWDDCITHGGTKVAVK